jgi:hypothetical protein
MILLCLGLFCHEVVVTTNVNCFTLSGYLPTIHFQQEIYLIILISLTIPFSTNKSWMIFDVFNNETVF